MIKVFLICSGLGHIRRGFESFTQECFEALSKEPELNITLFQGGEDSSRQAITLWNLSRNSWMATQLGKITGRGGYFIEQISFFLSLLPHIHRERPDVIYFSDGNLGNLLWRWRQLTKENYKLLYCNGGPLSPPFPCWDHIQQVAPHYFRVALDAGEPTCKQSLVPYGINVPKLQSLDVSEKQALRRQLKLPEKQPLLLSVGAINKSHKRMDYVVRETAAFSKPRPYLLLLGQQEPESSEIFQMGHRLLGRDGFEIRTVDKHDMVDYYRVADAFILASLSEGFGRVFLEAMSYGLPCLTHDYEVTRFVLGDEGYLANLELSGNLTSLIRQVLTPGNREHEYRRRHRTIYDRFSWEKLRPLYVQMIQQCAISETQKAAICL